MKRILLTQGYTAIIDDEDYDWVSGFTWRAVVLRTGYIYAITTLEYTGRMLWMHRHIMQIHDSHILVDHRNHDGLNNRKYNLRACTRSQNAANQEKTRGVSRFKGVIWHKRDKRWCARIGVNQKDRWLGCFKSEVEAAKVYDHAAKKYFGEFAMVNFPRNKA